jgi:hypothetical protein
MADAPNDLPTVDPDNVAEIICAGKFNVALLGPLATLTFTHPRPKVAPMMDRNVGDVENVVRARIVIPANGLRHLRDIIDGVIKNQLSASTFAAAGEPSKKN